MTDGQKIRQLENQLADLDESNGSKQASLAQKIDLLNELAWALGDIDMQRAQSLSETAQGLAELPAAEHRPSQIGLAYSLRTQGYVNMRLGNHSLGLSQLFKAQEIFEALQFEAGLAEVLDHIAGIHYQIGNFPESLKYIYQQLESAQKVGDNRLIADAYNNLANIYFETGDYERAIETLRNNLQLAVEIDYPRIETLSYLNLAETYGLAGNHQQALENARQGLAVSRAAGFALFDVYALDIMGKSYLKLGDAAQAIDYLEQALALSQKTQSKVTESLALLNIGQAYYELQQYAPALDYAQQAIATAESIDGKNELVKGHLLLSDIYEQQGKMAQALHHFKQHHTLKEIVFGQKADERLAVLHVAHDTEAVRKEAELHRLHNAALTREIAERRRQEERLRLMESIVTHNTDGVLVTEVTPLDPPGPRIVYANQALVAMTGYAKEEMLGQTPRMFQGPKTDRLVLDQLREALEHGQPISVELINYTKTGQEFWIELSISPLMDETGHPTHFVAIQREITTRKRIEEALELSQERYHLATGAAAVGVWDWNLRTGDFYLDPIIKAILGYRDDEIPNDLEIWTSYVHPADRQAVMETAQAHLEGRTPEYAYEHRMLHRDGSVRWVFVHGKAINDEQGQVVRMVGTDTDITARKNAELRVQRQLEYVRALSACSQALLAPAENEIDERQLLVEALQHLVGPARASKIFLYENFEHPQLGFCSRFLMDACASGIPSLLDQPDPEAEVIPWSIAPLENCQRLAGGQPVGGPVRKLFASTPSFRDYLLDEVHVLSVQFFPIHFGNKWWGYVGFDDRQSEREWTEDEILLLGTAAEMLSSTLQRWRAENRLRRMNDQLEQQVRTRTADLSDTITLLQQEIKERERAEAEIQQMVETLERRVAARTEELATFFDLTLLAGQAVSLTEVFEQALPRVLEVVRSRAICLHLFDGSGDAPPTLRLAAQQNLPPEAFASLENVSPSPNFQRWLQQPQDPLITAHLHALSILPPAFQLKNFQSYLGAQIKVGPHVEGVLSCYRVTERGFGVDEIALMVALAEQLGMVLETHRLRRHTQEMAVLEERQRLARDLHDSVTQSLYSLTLFSRAGQEAAEDGDPQRLHHSLSQLEQNTLHALREMRLLLYELRPTDLEQEGLIRAVELRLNTVERRIGLQLDVRLDELSNLSPKFEVELYHIIVEALNNVAKHAAANHLTVHLTHPNDHLNFLIADNGRGFDPAQIGGGLGLRNIRERVARLNGQLSIVSQPGQGTRLEAVIPFPKEKTQ